MNKTIRVDGMTCGHCAETVHQAVATLDGVSKVSVDLEGKQVQIDFDENRTGVEEISSQIKEAGFEVVPS